MAIHAKKERRANQAALSNLRNFLAERIKVLGMEGEEISRIYNNKGCPLTLNESDLFRLMDIAARAISEPQAIEKAGG